MLMLYVKTGCPYSARVRDALRDMHITLEERNITGSEEYEKQLLEKGGKHETPYLYDEEKGIGVYESEEIVRYLRETYGKKKE